MLNENGMEVDTKRDILEEIAQVTRVRIEKSKETTPLDELRKKCETLPKRESFRFEKALREKGITFICEVKKASPSKGLIAKDFPYVEIAKEYEEAGAGVISCLTEPHYFQGENKFLEEIVKEVQIPVLRKDFFVDPYMIYEAKLMGASGILLICAILTDKELKAYFALANELGLSSIFEAHTEEEVERALKCGARILGVNNRNLKTFQVDLSHSIELRKKVPKEVIFISESGIKTKEDMKLLYSHGTDAVLIGETFMRATNKKEMFTELKSMLLEE